MFDARLAAVLLVGVALPGRAPAEVTADRLADLVRQLESSNSILVQNAALEELTLLAEEAAPAVPAVIAFYRDRRGSGLDKPIVHFLGASRTAVALPILIEALDTAAHNNSFGFQLAEAFGRYGSASIGALEEVVASKKPWKAKYFAITALGEIGLEGVPALRRLVHSRNKRVRVHAVNQLGRVRPPAVAAVDDLIRSLDDPSLRDTAIGALGHIGPASAPAVGRLRKLLRSKNERIRNSCAIALGHIGPAASAAVPDLIRRTLEDPSDDVRGFAVGALGEIGGPKAVAAMVRVLADRRQNADVRQSAAYGLGQIGPSAAAAVPTLVEAMRERGFIAQYAARALGNIGPAAAEDAGPALRAALADRATGSIDVVAALQALFDVRAPDLLNTLRSALRHPDPKVRTRAARLLGELGPDAAPAVADLIAALKDKESNSVRERAIPALVSIGPAARPAVPHLLELAGEESPCGGASGYRGLAAQALAKWQVREAIAVLRRALRDDLDSFRRRSAALGLGAFGEHAEPALPELEALFADHEVGVRMAARRAAAKIRAGDATAEDWVEPTR